MKKANTVARHCRPKAVLAGIESQDTIVKDGFQRINPIPAAEAFSFLKQTKGVVTWSVAEMAAALHIRTTQAERVLQLLQLQGYVKPAADAEGWLTTTAGETVSGSRQPRYNREAVENALETLQRDIQDINRDRGSEFHIAEAVAFGDFLIGASKVQRPDVGVHILCREPCSKSAFIEAIQRRNHLVQIQPYEVWMRHRSHKRIT